FGGTLLYELHEFCSHEIKAKKRFNRISILFLGIAGICCYMNLHWPGTGALAEGEDLWVNIRIVLTVMVWAPIVFLASQIKLNRKSVMKKISGWTGSFATSVYIWHWPVIYLFYSWIRIGYIGWGLESKRGILIVWGSVFGISLISDSFLKRKKQKARS
ncbi:MAG: acyltransferase family protein, partial [Lachnospiraceae bacterium]|nr:acyltransferase family protein [Lachnospiraceae bacterium]